MNFPVPDDVTRRELWVPWAKDLDLDKKGIEVLSEKYALTGGEIRNVAGRSMATGEKGLAAVSVACDEELKHRTVRPTAKLELEDDVTKNINRRDFLFLASAFGSSVLVPGWLPKGGSAALSPALKIFPVKSGVKDLDRLIGGFHPGDLTIIAARPYITGKTAVALKIIENNVLVEGKAIALFSLEMTQEQTMTLDAGFCGGSQYFRFEARPSRELREWADLVRIGNKFSQALILDVDDSSGLDSF